MADSVTNSQDSIDECFNVLGRECLSGLHELLRARRLSIEADVDIWQFAVELSHLDDKGLTQTHVRWLVARGYVLHGEESAPDEKGHRSFKLRQGFAFSKSTALTLSTEGELFVVEILEHGGAASPGTIETKGIAIAILNASAANDPMPENVTPEWDAELRELRVQGKLVKSFRVPAGNQELILSAFQEEGWPRRIFDPLPPEGAASSVRRMHNAISRLNGKQTHRLIRFSGSGNGRGISWAWISETEADHE